MSTNPTHGDFKDILALAKPDLQLVCEALRTLITSLDKDFVEVVWPNHKIASFGIGPKKLKEHYAYIAVQGSHINLGFYHGAALQDSEDLLEGAGKKLRHIKFQAVSSVTKPAITALLQQAISERQSHAIAAQGALQPTSMPPLRQKRE